eukprot:1178077-Rhodomonas_salina.1
MEPIQKMRQKVLRKRESLQLFQKMFGRKGAKRYRSRNVTMRRSAKKYSVVFSGVPSYVCPRETGFGVGFFGREGWQHGGQTGGCACSIS